MKPKINIIDLRLLERFSSTAIFTIIKIQIATSYFGKNVGRVGVKSDTVYKDSNECWCIISTPFHFHFLVHLHFNLVSSHLAIFSTRMAIGMIYQMIECYLFSCQFAVF